MNLSEDDWERIFTIAHKGSINVNTQENNFKLASRWYRTPTLLNRFDPRVPNSCWRCSREPGSLLHIWWECPNIKTFWTQIHQIITKVTTHSLDFNPVQFLLHHSNIPASSYCKTLPIHLINAAKLCIPIHWGSTHTPSLKEWISRVKKIYEMEELIHIAKDTPRKFSTAWACWKHFQTTKYYSDLLDTDAPQSPQ